MTPIISFEIRPVNPERDMTPEGAEHLVRVWRGFSSNRSANTEHFTTEQLRDYADELIEYVNGLGDGPCARNCR